MKTQLAVTKKGVSVPDLIRSIKKPGEINGVPFPIEQDNYLRNTCSLIFKSEFPDRKYSVKRVREKGHTLVYWEYKD